MPKQDVTPFQLPAVISYSVLLASSYRHWMKENLLPDFTELPSADFARALYEAPFPLVSHGTEADPIFRYANRAAQKLWELDWDAFVSMPSRLSAEPVKDIQGDRQRLLQEALKKGFVRGYRGIRIASTGKRFEITDTVLWNVIDEQGVQHGQAAQINDYYII
ncbi:MAG: hypothetical protein K0R63_1657 [Rickettsiales bacterium]|jgi:hypothetical protein|nr:hypothetical protein [Rickettsiales bacterium]